MYHVLIHVMCWCVIVPLHPTQGLERLVRFALGRASGHKTLLQATQLLLEVRPVLAQKPDMPSVFGVRR